MSDLLPPFSLKSPSFEDRKRLGIAQRRKGGNFKSKSRYSSLDFLVQVLGLFPCFLLRLRIVFRSFVKGVLVLQYSLIASLMLGVIKDSAFNNTFLGFYLGDHFA